MSVFHRTLSMIPNRYAFLDKVQRCLDEDSRVSLFLIDVVRFSDVSTSFGYQAGDYILAEIARRIQAIFGKRVSLGRISGDIFCLVIPGTHDERKLKALYVHLNEHFKTPISVGDHAFAADFNVGAIANPDRNTDVNKLFSAAEAALKKAKSNKYDNFAHVNLKQEVTSGRALALKADLKRALTNNELELYFQPKVDLRSLQIIGAECLLRWNHPLDGVLFPGSLIEAAESYNMMNELGYWAIQQAFESSLRLQALGYDLQLAVNISPTQLYDSQFIPKLRALGEQMCINLGNVELELTEDIAMSNSLLVSRQLAEARKLGFEVAIDDFGKGYSNLAYIRDLSIDTIKIDKTFVMQLLENPVNEAIVQATQVIAKSLQCKVVAEGIESVDHLHILRKLGVQSGQGFLFSQAVPFNAFIELLQSDLSVGGSYSFRQRA
ncbi:MAG: putative bifunctional diguanylate cyclase/phosphodiesterase [Aestuariibacter sp.]